MSWKAFEVPQVPPILTGAVSALDTVSSTATSVLGIVKGLVEVLAKLELARLDAGQLVIKASLTAIENAINSLLTDAGVYVLFVPPRKKLIIPAVVQAAMEKAGLTSLPSPPLSTELFALEGKLSPAEVAHLKEARGATGGNLGFIRTVVESLTDIGDANRPQPKDTDHVVGLYIVGGADQFPDATRFTNLLSAVMGAGKPEVVLAAVGLPVPQNVRARQVAGGVNVEWAAQKPLVPQVAFGTAALVEKVAIIRSQNPELLSAGSVQELFNTTNLTPGLVSGVADEAFEVAAVLDYTFLAPPRSWVDTATLDQSKSYYYAASFSLKMGSAAELSAGGGQSEGFGRLSNAVKFVPKVTPSRTVAGTPPDWLRTPSVLELIPDLAGAVRLLSAQVNTLGGSSLGFGDMLKSYVKYLEAEILAYQMSVSRITKMLSRLTAGGGAMPGAYVRSFSGEGGVPYLMSDVLNSFNETNAPPFTRGQEFVAGVVVLAYAPSAAALAPVQAALNLLFGGADSREVSSVQAAISQIDVLLDDAAEALGLMPPEPEAGPVRVGLDDDGTKDVNCPAPAAPLDFNEDFTPKEK